MPGLPSSEMQAPRPCPAPSGHPGSQGLCEFGAQVRGVWHSGAEASYFIAEPCEGRGSGGCTEVVRRVGLGRRRGEDKLQKGRGGGRGQGGQPRSLTCTQVEVALPQRHECPSS